MPETAIVAALEREVWPLVKRGHISDREYAGKRFRFFEGGTYVAVCGGIGAEAARRATEAIIALYQPSLVQSVGFAGALEDRWRVGEVLELRYVVDASDGSRIDTGAGAHVLVSFGSVAGKDQKSKLANAYRAQVVDMEAAAVAKGAQVRGLRFRAIKVISDEFGFVMPDMQQFLGSDGKFRAGKFAVYTALRPWLWGRVVQLARNSAEASRALSAYLQRDIKNLGQGGVPEPVEVAKGEKQ